jgi:hypothetical protein
MHRIDNPVVAAKIEPQHDAEALSEKTGQLMLSIFEDSIVICSYSILLIPLSCTKGFLLRSH